MLQDSQVELCNDALDSVRQLIPDQLYWDVHGYVNRYDECQRGMEILLDRINREGVKIYTAQFRKVKLAMASLGLGGGEAIDALWRNDVLHS